MLKRWTSPISRWLLAAFALFIFAGPVNAQEPDVMTQYRNGDAALRLGHVNAAFEIFTTRCAEGSAEDCYREGDMHRRAMGTDQDYEAAGTAYQKACDLDHASACLALGNIHFTGQGLEEDYEKARALYTRGCDLNEPAACAVLGNMMYVGMGGSRDRIAGADHMRRACLQEVEYACNQVRRYGLSNKGERSNTLRRGWWTGN